MKKLCKDSLFFRIFAALIMKYLLSMRKVYYIYNPRTQTYDRIYPTVRQRALSILRRLFFGMGLGAGGFIVLLLIFGSPSEKELRKENSRLQAQYNVLSRRMDEAMGVLQDVQQRDDNLYRVIFQADPIPSAIRKAGYGGTNRYEHLMDMANSDLVVNTTQKMDMLTKQLYIQSRSFDDVVEMCKNHDEMLRCIPAIQPISNKDLRKTASGYGTRIDLFTELPVFMPAWTFRPIRERMYMQPVTALLLKWDGKPVMEILSSWIMASVTRRGMPTCRDSVPNSANGWCGARLSVRLEVPAKVQDLTCTTKCM
mgnify:CR=1 FL=1